VTDADAGSSDARPPPAPGARRLSAGFRAV